MGGNCSTYRVGDKCNADRVVSNRPDIIIKNKKDERFVMIDVAVLAERNST
jgi:hypothetical protein